MNPKYRFQLEATYGGTVSSRGTVLPVYKEDLALEWAKQSGEQFFRANLSDALIFINEDADWIESQNFNSEFDLKIYINYGSGESLYWEGVFYKADCEFDLDDKQVKVTPKVKDGYSKILDAMDKEFDLIKLAPAITTVELTKRPIMQFYALGDNKMTWVVGNVYWETDCEEIDDEDELLITYHFISTTIQGMRRYRVLGDFTAYFDQEDTSEYLYYKEHSGSTYTYIFKRLSDGATFQYLSSTNVDITQIPLRLYRVDGDEYSYINVAPIDAKIYTRIIVDVEKVDETFTIPIPADDIVENNRNYHHILMMNISNAIQKSSQLSSTPTEWGIFQPNQYYVQYVHPLTGAKYIPICHNIWGRSSLWFSTQITYELLESKANKTFMLKDAYSFKDALSALLGAIDSNVTFGETTSYSEFLYSNNRPMGNAATWLFLTPKSNILIGEYSQAAQKAPITLRTLMDMMKNVYQCYWFLDGNKFRVEHIAYFKNGMSYSGSRSVEIDLTTMEAPKLGKKWAFSTSSYKYGKLDTYGSYQFKWMDDVSYAFIGTGINITSPYVDKTKNEKVEVADFTSDIDYMLGVPNEVNEDGFALLACFYRDVEYQGLHYKQHYVPVLTMRWDSTEHYVQNGHLSFYYLLPHFYTYDLPARGVTLNGIAPNDLDTQYPYIVNSIKKIKSQEVSFPALTDPNTMGLIKTYLGNGVIDAMELQLESRIAKVTLKYDAE